MPEATAFRSLYVGPLAGVEPVDLPDGTVQIGALSGLRPGNQKFVDTVNGSDSNSGNSWSDAYQTMDKAFDNIQSNGTIFVIGDIREEVTTPLGVYGVKIIGAPGGRPRHSTSGGTVVDGNGVSWREPASGATSGGALLAIIEQGWEVHNILFVPKSDGTAIRLRRRESASVPDASHAILRNLRIIGGSVSTQIGIEDDGGCGFVVVEDCEFWTMEYGIRNTSAIVANPLRWRVRRCKFFENTHHIDSPGTQWIVEESFFDDATSVVELDGGGGLNMIINIYVGDATAGFSISGGYNGESTDIWRVFVTDAADPIVAAPA